MKNLFIKIYVNNEAKPEVPEESREALHQFYKENKNTRCEWHLKPEEEVRRLKANRYLFGSVYREFIPGHFQNVNDAHEYYTEKFLSVHDELDLDDPNFLKELNRIQKLARKILKYEVNENIVILDWVKTTTKLTKKQFYEYTNLVILDGQERGIEFTPIDQYDEYKNI